MLCYNGYAKKIYKYIDGSGLDLRHLRRIAGRLNDKGEIAPLERQTGNMFNRHWYPGSRQETNKYQKLTHKMLIMGKFMGIIAIDIARRHDAGDHHHRRHHMQHVRRHDHSRYGDLDRSLGE